MNVIQINQDVKSDGIKRVYPPLSPTINPVSAGEQVHTTGTGIPNYWIHQIHKSISGGGDTDTFVIKEDGNWRSLNYFPKLEVGDTVTVSQMKNEFSNEENRSKPVTITVT